MIRFSLISTVHSMQDSNINDGFTRRLALQPAGLGPEAPLLQACGEESSPVRERYAPMHRLLAPDDELFLVKHGHRSAAKKLRRQHRSCYFGYLQCLASEVRAARKLSALAMASTKNWSFWTLLAGAVSSETSLLYLRWLGCRHAAGVSVAARDIKECLDFLLTAPRFRR